jgi:deazaflavin-dependent oxidoreductase (nitroreductase family)
LKTRRRAAGLARYVHHASRPAAPPLVTDGDRLLLIASNYGKTSHPAWYRNLVANPKVEVLAGKHTGTYAASEITDPAERERAWDLALNQYAGYADYEGRSGDRTIPLVRLERASG